MSQMPLVCRILSEVGGEHEPGEEALSRAVQVQEVRLSVEVTVLREVGVEDRCGGVRNRWPPEHASVRLMIHGRYIYSVIEWKMDVGRKHQRTKVIAITQSAKPVP